MNNLVLWLNRSGAIHKIPRGSTPRRFVVHALTLKLAHIDRSIIQHIVLDITTRVASVPCRYAFRSGLCLPLTPANPSTSVSSI